jgi:hypothetical protein
MSSGGQMMPFSFGATSAGYSASGSVANQIPFDPRVPFTVTLNSSGNGVVFLGGALRPTGSQTAGSYATSITLLALNAR